MKKFDIGNALEKDFKSGQKTTDNLQKQQGPKDGQIALTAVLEHFIHSHVDPITKQKQTSTSDAPPASYKLQSQDGKKSWPAPIEMKVSVVSFNQADNLTRQVVDEHGRISYEIAVTFKYFKNAEQHLINNAASAYQHSDEHSAVVREYVDATGNLIQRKWVAIQPKDSYKVSVSDNAGNIFREKLPEAPSVHHIQPGAKLSFLNVLPEAWVYLKEVDVSADAGAASAALHEMDATTAGEEEINADAGKTRKEIRILHSVKFVCKAKAQLVGHYDSSLSATERKHETENVLTHNLVPIKDFVASYNQNKSTRIVPHSLYFRVERQAVLENGVIGMAMVRETVARAEDFLRERDNELTPLLSLRCCIYQWKGPFSSTDASDKYLLTFLNGKPKENILWNCMGISSPRWYQGIMVANTDIPIHVNADLWAQATATHEANNPETINAEDETKNVRGYYTFMIKSAMPDLLRYFVTSGMRLSKERVEREFDAMTMLKKDGTKIIQLTPSAGASFENPVNRLGLASAVLSIGAGTVENGDVPVNVAFNGNLQPLLASDKYQFYFISSHLLTPDERVRYAQGQRGGEVADAFLDKLIANENVFYWIYAVKTDAKMASDFVLRDEEDEEEEEAKEEDTKAESNKRGREDEEDSDGDSITTKQSRIVHEHD